MATFTFTDDDLQRADQFLSSYLAEKVPEGDFSQGSALRDLAVKAICFVFAFLESERKTAAAHGSLLALSKLPPSAEVDAAVDAFLTNLFVFRKGGTPSKVTALLHFSAPADVTIRPSIRFFRTSDLLFFPDVTDTLVIPAGELRLTTNSNGTSDYVCTVPLVAAAPGTNYNVSPGKFTLVDKFNPFFTYAENVSEAISGKPAESTKALLDRAPNALSTRNLINERSANAIVAERFPEADRVLAIGMGDPEMVRDIAPGRPAQAPLHLGGCVDLFVGLPRTTVTVTGTLGGAFARPDGRICVLRDAQPGAFTDVRVGHVVKVTSQHGPTVWQREALISRVSDSEIEIQTVFPFATDETNELLTYSIGTLAPDFADVVGSHVAVTATTSRHFMEPGCMLFPAGPVYAVKSVVTTDGSVDTPVPTRVDTTPLTSAEYQLQVLNPQVGQSSRAVTVLRLRAADHNGTRVKVTYDTLAGFAAIDGFVTGRFDRVLNANHLARGDHPVYVQCAIAYDRRYGAKTTYDRTELAQHVVDYVNAYDWTNVLDVASIVADLKTSYPDIGSVYPFQLGYTLHAPDGSRVPYQTGDIASVLPPPHSSAARIGGDTDLENLGVSDRNVRYFADLADVYVYERGVDPSPGEGA